jgi:hypothetical protein
MSVQCAKTSREFIGSQSDPYFHPFESWHPRLSRVVYIGLVSAEEFVQQQGDLLLELPMGMVAEQPVVHR